MPQGVEHTYQIIEQRENVVLDGWNLGDMLHRLPFDQGQELRQGETISTYGFLYEGGQRGQLTVYHSQGRAAIFLGGDSDWGDWDHDSNALRLPQYDDTRVWVVDVVAGKIWEEADVSEEDE